jgi:poly [ADP-ribose] polymerase
MLLMQGNAYGWHRSRCSNFGENLSQGLRIALEQAPVHDLAWGKGMYLTDESRKSWELCEPRQSDDTAVLLLCEAQSGAPVYEVRLVDFDAGEELREKESKAAVQSCWKGWECVDAGQVNKQLA